VLHKLIIEPPHTPRSRFLEWVNETLARPADNLFRETDKATADELVKLDQVIELLKERAGK